MYHETPYWLLAVRPQYGGILESPAGLEILFCVHKFINEGLVLSSIEIEKLNKKLKKYANLLVYPSSLVL